MRQWLVIMLARNTKLQPFVDAVTEWADYEQVNVRPNYSGRGMYGRKCLGVVVSGINKAFDLYYFIGTYALNFCENNNTPFPRTPDACTDNMGRDMIVYWPDVEVIEEKEE